MRKACGVEVLLFEIARCLWICSSFYSNFEKQNRKGSPQSLIYPYKGKLTSFVIKQFFAFGREHQTLSRSRLRRFCSERCIAADADQNANCFYAAVCTLLSPQNFDSRFAFAQDDNRAEYARKVSAPQWFGSTTKDPCRGGRDQKLQIPHSSPMPTFFNASAWRV